MTTILIVDDEYLIADILGFVLEDEGYTVVKATSGAKALDELERHKPSLVITDYMMPLMNGVEFAQQIRERDEKLPIILISGAQSHIGRSSPELFAAVFDKPFDTPKLIAKVKELLEQNSSFG
jgi:CheY-like chemotaxis protein